MSEKRVSENEREACVRACVRALVCSDRQDVLRSSDFNEGPTYAFCSDLESV